MYRFVLELLQFQSTGQTHTDLKNLNFRYAGFQKKFNTPLLKPTKTEPSFQKAQLTPYKTMYAFLRSPPGQGVMPINLLPVISGVARSQTTPGHCTRFFSLLEGAGWGHAPLVTYCILELRSYSDLTIF